ncbi:MAG: hypothetical protein HY820_45390 [Acidobacteria bacterium]|nr:hypothetical protein [Acidobacteriota bacterium]
MRNLPVTGEWLMVGNWLSDPPFAVLNMDFSTLPPRGSVRIGDRNSRRPRIGQLTGVRITAPDTFVATYSLESNSGSFSAQYLDDADLTVNFLAGTIVNTFSASVQSVVGDPFLRMSDADKLGAAINKALPLLPEGMASQLRGLLTPEALSIMALFASVWAYGQFSPHGWIADAVLLGAGIAILGVDAIRVAGEIYDFVITAVNAKTEQDLEEAGKHFAAAAQTVGLYAVFSVLFANAPKPFQERFRNMRNEPNLKPPTTPGKLFYEPPPPARVKYLRGPDGKPSSNRGGCDGYGRIIVAEEVWQEGRYIRKRTAREMEKTLSHEGGHAFLCPKLQVLREFRVRLGMESYIRSHFLRYLEEALVEARAAARQDGLAGAWAGIQFPVKNGYVTIAQLCQEAFGVLIGPVCVEGKIYNAWFSESE